MSCNLAAWADGQNKKLGAAESLEAWSGQVSIKEMFMCKKSPCINVHIESYRII